MNPHQQGTSMLPKRVTFRGDPFGYRPRHEVAERSVGKIVTKANIAMLGNTTHPCPQIFRLDAILYACHCDGFSYKHKIGTSPYFYLNQRHIHLKYLHPFWTPVYFTVPAHERMDAHKTANCCCYTGKVKGFVHRKCYVDKVKIKIPLFFHNANYDIKCFINSFRKLNPKDYLKKIGGVPCNMEIFKSLNIDNICIMDSYAHLSSSLSTLIENLPDNKKITLKTITNDPEKSLLINKKGFYPYGHSRDSFQVSTINFKSDLKKDLLTLG